MNNGFSSIRTAFIAVMLLVHSAKPVASQMVRGIRDSIGFCWTSTEMTRFIHFLDSVRTDDTTLSSPVAAISPHDDFLSAGRVYHPLFKTLRTKEVVIFGVTHGSVRREIGDPRNVLLLETNLAWTGPYGPVGCSPLRDLILTRANTSLMRIDNRAHALEHSIEALLPFLQHYNPHIRITPIMVTAMDFDRMDSIAGALSIIISDYIRRNNLRLGSDIAFLISSDANHYGNDFGNAPWGEDHTAHATAIMEDRRIIQQYIDGRLDSGKIRSLSMALQSILWCGRYSVPFGLLTTAKVVRNVEGGELEGRLIRYSDTFTEGVNSFQRTSLGTTAPFSLKHWVGFFSAGFYPWLTK